MASVQDKNREIPWCWLRGRCRALHCRAWAPPLGEDDHFSCHFKKEATQPWKIDGPLYTIVWCYNVHKECQICSDQRLIQGTFGRGKLCKEKFLTLNTQRRLLSFQLEKKCNMYHYLLNNRVQFSWRRQSIYPARPPRLPF